MLFIVATAMMMGYFVNDVMSPLETLLEMPKSEGGLGWSSSDRLLISASSLVALRTKDHPIEVSWYSLFDDFLYPEFRTRYYPDARRTCQ